MEKSLTKFFWFGHWFLEVSVANELYYTTSKSGSRAYYFFRLGYQRLKVKHEVVVAPVLTMLFIEISAGKLLRQTDKE